jgi:hypothetical protein
MSMARLSFALAMGTSPSSWGMRTRIGVQ